MHGHEVGPTAVREKSIYVPIHAVPLLRVDVVLSRHPQSVYSSMSGGLALYIVRHQLFPHCSNFFRVPPAGLYCNTDSRLQDRVDW
jgi:hypothetical protein